MFHVKHPELDLILEELRREPAPPARLEARLRAEFRRRRPQHRWLAWTLRAAAIAIPVAVLVNGLVLDQQPRQSVEPAAQPALREVTTEFFPLDAGPTGEEARLVRVRLPRGALRSFGLPMDEERAAEKILADVVLGEDGTARAVRFVSFTAR